MAAPSSIWVKWGQYLLARLAATSVEFFEVGANLRTAAVLGRILCQVYPRIEQRSREHIRLSFPEYSPQEVERLAVQSIEHLVQWAVEVIHTPRLLHSQSWSQHLRLGNFSQALELLNGGQGTIMVSGHLGNWEVLGYLMAVLGYRMDALARPLDNPLVNDWMLGIRQKRGMRIITKWDATAKMEEVLDAGGALGFIADQNAGDRGLFVPFFGRLASSYKSIGLLAISRNLPIVCGYARRVGDGFDYELGTQDLILPRDWQGQRDPLYYVTARWMRALEDMIRACPQQYWWMHRRWKSRPRFEREGKPMPAGLRRNLEELPWLSQTERLRLGVS